MPKALVTGVAQTPLISVECEQLVMVRANPRRRLPNGGRSRPFMVTPEGLWERPGPTTGRVRGVVAPEG